jgi:sterol desaturase/sphingolipid hydroxylase (fatty acid hydroxylase superfamily)
MELISLEAVLAVKSLVVLAVLTLLLSAQWRWPWRPAADRPPRWPRLRRNIGLWLINTLISPLIVVPIAYWASMQGGWRDGATGWGWLLLDLLILDAWIYLWHRANHEIHFLWRWHQVHHLDETLDVTSAVRFHFGEVLLSALARALVVVVFDVPLGSVLIFETIVLVCALFQHADLELPPQWERRLSWIVITPGLHWVHHHARRADTDSNYGTMLSLWDRLAGTLSATQRWRTMPIGLERDQDRGFVALLLCPFSRRRE